MDTINEKTTYVVTATFTDYEGDPVTPNTGVYSLYNLTGGRAILSDEVFTPTASTHDFEITHLQNAIVNPNSVNEMMILTINFLYDNTRRGTSEYRYLIKNLKSVS